jgi:hypothetical protein
MNKFENLWSIKEHWWDSDIDLIQNNKWEKKIYKKYYTKIHPNIKDNPTFSIEDIKKYHSIQNETKLINSKIKLNEPVTLLWNKIKNIVIDILKLDIKHILLASDLETQLEIIITNPEYIEWTTFNEYLKNIEYKKSKAIKKIITENIESNRLFYPLNWWSFYISQISTFNIKVRKIKNETIYLTITDLAQNIKEIIK